MDFGLAIFATDESVAPDVVAAMAEERGFESLFFTEHTHIPASRRTPYPVGGELPREYYRTLDPLIAMTAAAAATERLLVGSGILLVAQRDPIVTAKALASIDLLSQGRVLFGVGAGWNEEEMENHGVLPGRRFGVMREHVEAIKAIWTQEQASYHGAHVDFEAIYCWPKPVQDPHPPVLVGGNGRTVLDRVLAYGDAWYPNRFGDDDRFIARIEKLQRRGRDEAGRDHIPVTLQLAPTEPQLLERYERAGVTRALWYLPSGPAEQVERALDRCALARDAAVAA